MSAGLVPVGEALGRDEADVEDVFPPKTYREWVDAAYAGALAGNPVTVEDLAGGDRITNDVGAIFAARGVTSASKAGRTTNASDFTSACEGARKETSSGRPVRPTFRLPW